MADKIPAIRVTDPQSRDTVPETTGANRGEGSDYAAGSRSASPKEGRWQGEDQIRRGGRLTAGSRQTSDIRRPADPWTTASLFVRHAIEPGAARARSKRQRSLVASMPASRMRPVSLWNALGLTRTSTSFDACGPRHLGRVCPLKTAPTTMPSSGPTRA